MDPRTLESKSKHRRIENEPKDKQKAVPKSVTANPRKVTQAGVLDPSKCDPHTGSPEHYVHTSPKKSSKLSSSPLVDGFLEPQSGDYKGCYNYCKQNPGIWSFGQELEQLDEVAAANMNNDNAEQGRIRAERCLMAKIVRQAGFSASQANDYLKSLTVEGPRRDNFEAQLEKSIQKLAAVISSQASTTGAGGVLAPKSTNTAPQRKYSGGPNNNAVTMLGRDLRRANISNENSPNYPQATQKLGPIASPRERVSERSSQAPKFSTTPVDPGDADDDRFDEDTVELKTVGNRPKDVDFTTEEIGPNPDYLEDYDGKDDLNDTYILREKSEATRFWIKGRVFAMVWHENAGISNLTKTTAPLDKPFHTYTYTRDHIRVFSHIRRFVIVKARKGYCWAIPINSYGGRGLTSKNMSSEEKQAHAIVHARGTSARYMEGEGKLDKKPIAVDMAKDQKLTRASRLHFDKPQSIDWNIKAADVGLVQGSTDLRRLLFYFREESRKGEETEPEDSGRNRW